MYGRIFDIRDFGATLPHIDNAGFCSIYLRNTENVCFNNTSFTIGE